MKQKELRKMKRIELLDIIYALQENEKKLKEENAALEEKLANRVIKMEKEGSIAEAAVAISDIMKVAQDTADQYLQSVYDANKDSKSKADKMIENANQEAERILSDAKAKADAMIAAAKEKAGIMIKAADNYYETISKTAREAEKRAEEICMETRKQTAIFMIETNAANSNASEAPGGYNEVVTDEYMNGIEVIDV